MADTMSLYNWGFNVDGIIIDKANTPGPLSTVPPLVFNAGGFNFAEGGHATITVGEPAGAQYVDI
jgi:hypothetical protein